MALKLIDENIIDAVLDKIKSNMREHPNTNVLDGLHEVFVNLKSRLLPLPNSSDQEQDEIWKKEIGNIIQFAYITASVRPNDSEIESFIDIKIEELKSKFTITKK